MTEAKLLQDIRLALGRLDDLALWRNHRAVAWSGEVVHRDHETITLRNPRPATTGLFPGAPDLIGVRRVIVAPSMVGLPLGALVGIEVKGPRGRTSEDQEKALRLLSERFAAFAGVAADMGARREKAPSLRHVKAASGAGAILLG